MRKSITLPAELNDVIRKFSNITALSESAIISFCISNTCRAFNSFSEEDKFFESLFSFYDNYYIKKLPRGLKVYEKKKTT